MLPDPTKSYGHHDWTVSGYATGACPLVRHGFMGVLHSNDIQGKWFCDITQATHGDIGHTACSVRFRYLPYYNNGTIVWTDVTDATPYNIKQICCFIHAKQWPLLGDHDACIKVVDNLINKQFGVSPVYQVADIPVIAKRT